MPTKIKNIYRWHMIFKGRVKPSYGEIYDKLSKTLESSNVNFGLDINPFSMI